MTRITTATMTALAAFLLGFGCEGEPPPAAEGEVDVAGSAFETGCPSNAPLCSCALRGNTVCADPDDDGLASIDDNCDHVYNPNQANCDGDYLGDACDSDNVRVSRRTERADTNAVGTGRTSCVYDRDVHSMFFSEV